MPVWPTPRSIEASARIFRRRLAGVVAWPLMVDPETTYRRQTPGSRALHDSAVAVMPGGTTRTTTYFDPYPLYITRGEGCRLWDADGAERRDLHCNSTGSILGDA